MVESSLPVLGLTMGDPAGVGPEVIVRALADPEIKNICRPVVLGDLGALRQARDALGLDLPLSLLPPGEIPSGREQGLAVCSLSNLLPEDLVPGRPTPAGGAAAALYIEAGARLALAGRTRGVVTGPISKEALNKAGRYFPGHTEFLAQLSGGVDVVMMMAGPRLKVVLVTIHEALSRVPRLISKEKILSTVLITHRALKTYFGLENPRLALAALNPHAGEAGLFGREEETILGPALAEARGLGLDLSGPYPPDTLFYRASQGEFDVVVAMYHDQGLIPFKLLHFKDGVNVTLGLPFIRTSVDHGTAYDLAGRGRADSSSMKAALVLAADMARRSRMSA
ncbi:MAG: 4-hydroxythreonine-4-phosphate dehydrogenase PdxA [Pseudomonadota bacterium]